MHDAAFQFVARVRAGLDVARVLELGAYIVNGSVRPLFAGCGYVGVDTRPGPGVDIVADAETFDGGGAYDCVVTTEMLEHTPNPAAVIAAARRSLAPGGWLILTAAGPERAPHSCDGGPVVPAHEHYGNITPEDLRAWLAGWDAVTVEHNPQAGDVYALARVPTASETRATPSPRRRRASE